MALDQSKLGLENIFLENKSVRIFAFDKFALQNLANKSLVFKTTFDTFYTSHSLRRNSTIYHTDLGQNAVFHTFSRQIALGQYL